ncbi:MAG: DUF362 domain-containing protein, partial [Nanoarchaeota archaeon]|nr:DUF362 domain-containing protein [Nanoarchaeota archaeon]
KDRENIHNKGLDKGIKSLYEVNKRLIKYNVVDSIFVMEGNGPIKGDVKEGNAIFGGRDAECVDSFASTLIDIDEVPGYLETLKDYVLEGDDLGIRLKGPNLLSDKYYTGKPSLGFLGVFATMLDDIIFALGKNINFVFRGGRPKKNNINIGVNVPGLDHFVSGNPPSRRDIRKVLGVGLEKAISDINYHNELAREDYDET